jgi:acyl-CoA thioesterase FadM
MQIPFVSRRGIVEASTLHFRVWPNDCDLNIHMNNGRYLTFMDLGRLHLLAQCGLLRHVLVGRWAPILAAADINFVKPLPPFVRFTLITRLLAWDEKYFYIEQRFERRGETVAMAFVKGLFLARGRRLASAEVVEATGASAVSPPMPEALQHWLKMTDLKKKHADAYR